ncbi:NAD(P)/FAD-dependent oxidoreductase [Thiomicrorhabdus cannonii]|uniref:NAD(P)/FAD-dependent oxidoreductase n=1 Tax=Thiomicrorhabdus cannonii TaxID=2748011 RepID=UPI0015BD10C1|nr:FAD-dependent oxidoreductase [Thiomicrorhabdus cannonii]
MHTQFKQRLTQPQKVAVIGSGISGLASAWFLSQRHQVTLLEKANRLGGHTNTRRVSLPGKTESYEMDSGFIVFNRPNYPYLTAMLAHLGVATQPTEMSFAVSIDGGRLEYAGSNLNTLFAQRRNLLSAAHWKMLAEIVRFNRQAKADLKQPDTLTQTLGDYLQRHGFGKALREHYLLPMAAAIWSCPTATMMQFPVGSFLRFFENHGLLNVSERPQWETVTGGSQRYIDALLQQADFEVRLQAEALNVRRVGKALEITFADGSQECFDQVVLASHADQSFALLDDTLKPIFAPLRDFRYQTNLAYVHRDAAQMPKRRLAWSSWNYLRDSRLPEDRVAVTYWMNRLQHIEASEPLLVTLNPIVEPAADKVFEKIVYEHPVFDPAAALAQSAVQQHQGEAGIWFAGAWLGYGFHEDGLRSAVELARRWQLPLPWEIEQAGVRHA